MIVGIIQETKKKKKKERNATNAKGLLATM
jgi:hypothetical protein